MTNIFTGKGLIEQIKEVHELSNIITKENMKNTLMSISDESFEILWEKSFGESYEDFVNKILSNETEL